MSDNLRNRFALKENDRLLDRLLGGESNLDANAESYGVGKAAIYGAASFYDLTNAPNAGLRAHVCDGTACLVKGEQSNARQALAKAVGAEAVGKVSCLGRCHEGGSFDLDGAQYSGDAYKRIGKPSAETPYAVEAHGPNAPLTAPFPGLASYLEPLKSALGESPDRLIAQLEASKLRGRGGAGFPVHLKWSSCRNVESDRRYIVCNADEGDPGAYSDRYLLEQRPHSVLAGMIAAGYAVGASKGYLYIRHEYPEAIAIVEDALGEMRNAGWLGQRVGGSDFSFELEIVRGAGAYICGEETALIASIEGRRPEVEARPPYPTQRGLFGKPTVVNNVETFASVVPVLRMGGEAFAKIGTERSTGTKLISLDSGFNRPGVYEVPMGLPLETVLNELGNGFARPTKAIQVGGPLGGIVPKSHWDRLTIDFESFAEGGFLLGHGNILAIPESFPMIEYIRHLMEFTRDESCGKCFPCRLGSQRGVELADRAIAGEGAIDETLWDELLEAMELGSLCGLGGGAPLPIRNAGLHFADELKTYFTKEKRRG